MSILRIVELSCRVHIALKFREEYCMEREYTARI